MLSLPVSQQNSFQHDYIITGKQQQQKKPQTTTDKTWRIKKGVPMQMSEIR